MCSWSWLIGKKGFIMIQLDAWFFERNTERDIRIEMCSPFGLFLYKLVHNSQEGLLIAIA
jgi:hypothetical protein